MKWLAGRPSRGDRTSPLASPALPTQGATLSLRVTSNYLEGEHNALAAWGYNRDRKAGKQQLVLGLLTDSQGEPISVQVYPGNTSDLHTFGDQVQKVKRELGCAGVTLVGDRGANRKAAGRPRLADGVV